MSYAAAAALQQAVYDRLANDPALVAIVGSGIHDAPPPGAPGGTLVMLGPEEVQAMGDGAGPGAVHELTISVLSDAAGFASAKAAAVAVCDALDGAGLSLSRGRLVSLAFRRARAVVEKGGRRRIDQLFRARIEG